MDDRLKRMAEGKERAKKQREEEAARLERVRGEEADRLERKREEEAARLERERIAAEEKRAEMERRMTIAQAALDRFQLHYDMLMALLTEMREFAKRKQDGIITPVKVEMINRRLDELREILKDEEIFPFLEKLDMDRLPSNSDVVLVLGQYAVAMESHARGRYVDKPKGLNQKIWTVASSFLEQMPITPFSLDSNADSNLIQMLATSPIEDRGDEHDS
jgi:hypothetical protein